MKNVVVLGSTGSLGTQTVEVLRKMKAHFKVVGLSANKNKVLLRAQAKEFGVPKKNVVLVSESSAKELKRLASLGAPSGGGARSARAIIVNVLSGTAGIAPTIAALKAGNTLLLGNKESLVADGKKVMKLAKSKNSKTAFSSQQPSQNPRGFSRATPVSRHSNLIPLDSEHNAIYEILRQHPDKTPQEIYLPCSGGPFLGQTRKQLQNATPAQALAHPTWSMGAKISIESATLLNKGLEVVEAHYLFNLPFTKIKVFIEPDSQIHGAVKFKGEPAPIAYVSPPDMREHIENAFDAVQNCPSGSDERIRPITPSRLSTLPDHKTFPGIKIVLAAFRRDPKNMKSFLKKEEATIQKFLNGKITFLEVFSILDRL